MCIRYSPLELLQTANVETAPDSYHRYPDTAPAPDSQSPTPRPPPHPRPCTGLRHQGRCGQNQALTSWYLEAFLRSCSPVSGLCFHASSDRELTTSQDSHARDSVPVSNLAQSCPLGLTRTCVPLPQDCCSESGPMRPGPTSHHPAPPYALFPTHCPLPGPSVSRGP